MVQRIFNFCAPCLIAFASLFNSIFYPSILPFIILINGIIFNNFIKFSCNIKNGSTVSFIFPQDNDTMKPFHKRLIYLSSPTKNNAIVPGPE